ncbi:hypothetical protein DYD21_00750 [Rhodohalobacter sp. SW132]|uniref:asparagine synthase-related protein n=1 Tax=Rhodohalobacter sp. SW132 TaxID=2293433 RepID=UPI000E236651|nr:asparagine synthase-related protein [Rhodohalobacter sp. SW132]REL38509.1 hypothetical protein DYD21_00750 [Rhodohalobacter sp. SW132]
MAGIYGFYSKSPIHLKDNYTRFFSCKLEGVQNEEHRLSNFVYGRSVPAKFLDDRFLYENDQVVIGIEGIIYSQDNPKHDIPEMYRKQGVNFAENLKGSFSGFIFDKTEKKLHLLTDILATKSIYIYSNPAEEHLFFASELKVLTSLLRDLKIPFEPDSDGFNCLLTLGYMLNDLTLVREIRRLEHATIATFDLQTGSCKQRKYFDFTAEEQNIPMDRAIEQTDKLLTNAVDMEWKKDKQESSRSLTFISGGLDARVNALLAAELGYGEVTALNFSQTGAPDHLIAKEISEGERFRYRFYPLDGGKYFLDSFEELVAANDGMVTVSGGSHMYRALQYIEAEQFGMAHSGQIGDVLFGSFNRTGFDLQKNVGRLGYVNDQKVLDQISILPEITERYRNTVEQFSYEQRQINGTLNGDRLCSHIIDIQSPFYNKELIHFCLGLPEPLKHKKLLYTEWIRNKHPHFFNYRWDSTGIAPKNRALTKLFMKLNRAQSLFKRLLGRDRSSMNPFDDWFSENKVLRDQVHHLFQSGLKNMPNNEIKRNTNHIFAQYKARGKCNALTCVLAYKLHFIFEDNEEYRQ